MSLCPCGSKKNYIDCCEIYISGKKNAPSAESSMRARYSAFAKQEIDYIKNTVHPDDQEDFNLEEIRDWSTKSKWISLEIVDTKEGGPNDQTGVVEFKATYEIKGISNIHHEISEFKKIDDFWYFIDGKIIRTSVVRTAPKTGRNDPCPCGSGKKYKKCCLE